MSTFSSGGLRGARARKFKSEINVVPYIDVMLVLLIIFMVAAPLTNPGVINLPSAEKSTLPPTEYIQIALRLEGAASIGINRPRGAQHAAPSESPAPPEEVRERGALLRRLREMHAANPNLPVMISADKDIKYDEVIHVISEAKKFGILRVALATRQ